MSILREIRRGKVYRVPKFSALQLQSEAVLKSAPDAFLVDASAVNEFFITDMQDRLRRAQENRAHVDCNIDQEQFPACRPPHSHLMIEGFLTPRGDRGASHVERLSDDRFRLMHYLTAEGEVTIHATTEVSMDEWGGVKSCQFSHTEDCEDPNSSRLLGSFQTLFALHALCWLNCQQSFEIKKIPFGKIKARGIRPGPIPACVWHVIKISMGNAHKGISGGENVFPDEGCKITRCHWVRGHYRDYRKGPGMWGNAKLKILMWVREHQRGNPQLGMVIPEYKLG